MSWSEFGTQVAKALNPSNILALGALGCLVFVVWHDKNEMSNHLKQIRGLYQRRLELEQKEHDTARMLIDELRQLAKERK